MAQIQVTRHLFQPLATSFLSVVLCLTLRSILYFCLSVMRFDFPFFLTMAPVHAKMRIRTASRPWVEGVDGRGPTIH